MTLEIEIRALPCDLNTRECYTVTTSLLFKSNLSRTENPLDKFEFGSKVEG